MFRVELFRDEMGRLLLIPIIVLVLTLASWLYVWNPYTWDIETLEYGLPLPWLTSFTSGLGEHWAMNTVDFAVDYLIWLAVSAAGIFIVTLAQWKGIVLPKLHFTPKS
jgi:hypothetical protein